MWELQESTLHAQRVSLVFEAINRTYWPCLFQVNANTLSKCSYALIYRTPLVNLTSYILESFDSYDPKIWKKLLIPHTVDWNMNQIQGWTKCKYFVFPIYQSSCISYLSPLICIYIYITLHDIYLRIMKYIDIWNCLSPNNFVEDWCWGYYHVSSSFGCCSICYTQSRGVSFYMQE